MNIVSYTLPVNYSVKYNRNVLICELQLNLIFFFPFFNHTGWQQKYTTSNKAMITDSNETSEQAENTQHVYSKNRFL